MTSSFLLQAVLSVAYSDGVVDLQYCPTQNTLYGLHCLDDYNKPYLQKWDATTGQGVAVAYEFMEQWGLSCFCITDQATAGNEVIAGAANTGEMSV